MTDKNNVHTVFYYPVKPGRNPKCSAYYKIGHAPNGIFMKKKKNSNLQNAFQRTFNYVKQCEVKKVIFFIFVGRIGWWAWLRIEAVMWICQNKPMFFFFLFFFLYIFIEFVVYYKS